MSENKPDATVDRPVLLDFAYQLFNIVESAFATAIQYDHQNDHFGFMALGFVCKQAEHLHSICVLVKHGRDRDAMIIA